MMVQRVGIITPRVRQVHHQAEAMNHDGEIIAHAHVISDEFGLAVFRFGDEGVEGTLLFFSSGEKVFRQERGGASACENEET